MQTCEQRVICLIYHVEALLIAMSNLTRAKMASFIPEELTVDQIKQLMVSASDSDKATPLQSPDCEGITYPEGKHKELPDERVRQLDATRQAVIGAEYERRKYSIFFDENLRQSDRLSVTLKGLGGLLRRCRSNSHRPSDERTSIQYPSSWRLSLKHSSACSLPMMALQHRVQKSHHSTTSMLVSFYVDLSRGLPSA